MIVANARSTRPALPVPDAMERHQHWTRLATMILALAYFTTRALYDDAVEASTFLVLLCAIGCGIALFAWERLVPGVNRLRRLMAMAQDNFWISWFLMISPEAASALVGLYTFVTVGNGFRYGTAYLLASLALNVCGFATVVWLDDFWWQHPEMAVGLALLMLAIPLYTALLTRRLALASGELELARRRAEQASAAKSRFLSTMSHEMRTPLNAVIQANDLLLRNGPSRGWRTFVIESNGAARHLLELIDKVLDFAQIEADRVHIAYEPLALRTLLDEALGFLAIAAAERRLVLQWAVDPDVPDRVIGSAKHLKQVLVNLVGNAVQYTSRGGVSVTVRVVQADRSRTRLRFEVIDTGVGISAERLATIFEPFVQDRDAPRERAGTGLGTTISRDYVQRMGGTIGVVSQPDAGSTFWFELPFGLAEADAQPAQADARSRHRDGTLEPDGTVAALLVDDDRANRLLASRLLEGAGMRVIACADPLEALGALAGEAVDVVLVDRSMAPLDGFTLVRALREALPSPPPCLLVTADGARETLDEARLAGMHDVLSKPLGFDELLSSIDEVVRGARASGRRAPSAPAPVTASREVLDAVLANLHEAAARLHDRAAIDAPRLRGIAHKLAGASDAAGLKELVRYCRLLMALPHALDAATLERLRAGLAEQVEAARDRLAPRRLSAGASTRAGSAQTA